METRLLLVHSTHRDADLIRLPQNSRTKSTGTRRLLQNLHYPEYAGDDIISERTQYNEVSNSKSGTCSGGRPQPVLRYPEGP